MIGISTKQKNFIIKRLSVLKPPRISDEWCNKVRRFKMVLWYNLEGILLFSQSESRLRSKRSINLTRRSRDLHWHIQRIIECSHHRMLFYSRVQRVEFKKEEVKVKKQLLSLANSYTVDCTFNAHNRRKVRQDI